ncbi:hemerythrin domain-containing protein [Cognatazoarcus halotolerans]|uniref:hemerythrin domain-containing protein n=1 Tax=Cognatazoarcus halotolerans TaxID=2686016 RepID=UPI001358AAD2|nr:hemerythrin domain-containing protein [Cognatazoarcus halotolerans]MBX3680929.1 hemerythrin domain-containing protein [Rhodocyclaceae bacterium]MCB1900905.1 hemerythrin domain-containing protein [Rhodocyclaceae bacterium]MCP5311728.1 hemerythrin domain-containing protein [Zoogloeaceae bacterium]
MEALRIISDEHQSLAGILHAVRFMLKEVAAGRLEPDLKLFKAMVHYLEAYAELRHHPKEDVLFKYLEQRTAEGKEVLEKLAVQHREAPQRIAALEQALAAFTADPSAFAGFALAFERYADFYRNHILIEEDIAFPLLRQHLSDADWETVDREFRAEMQANSGKDGKHEDFSALFSKLVECAPAPLGFGPRPFND